MTAMRFFGKRVLIIGILILAFNIAKAQQSLEASDDSPQISGWNISGAVGSSVFLGDIKNKPLLPYLGNPNELRFVALVAGERRFNPWIASRLHLSYSHIAGTRKSWDIDFKAYVWESGITGLIYPVNFFIASDEPRFADVYVTAGVGLLNYNATLYQTSSNFVLAKRGYGAGRGINGTTMAGMLMGGLGVDFRLFDKLDLRIEITNKAIDNDLLDAWNSQFKYDVYNHLTFGVVYKLGDRVGTDKMFDQTPREPAVDLLSNRQVTPPKENKDNVENIQLTPVLEMPSEQPSNRAKVDPGEKVPEPEKPSTRIISAQPDEPVSSISQSAMAVIEYRVQIFASKRPFSKASIAKRFRLNENEITESRFEKFYVYSIGSFSSMEEALAFRDQLRRQNGVSDAFITIWENGRRVSPMFR